MSFLNLEGHSTDADSMVEGKAVLRMDRTIVGHNDEILDLRVIPSATPTSGDNMNDASAPPPAQKVAVATNSAQIRIFELGTYSCSVLDGHTETVLSIDVSPCGRYLSSCGKDKTMRLWHVESGKCVAIATGHTEAIGASALSRKLGRYDVGGKSARNGGGAFVLLTDWCSVVTWGQTSSSRCSRSACSRAWTATAWPAGGAPCTSSRRRGSPRATSRAGWTSGARAERRRRRSRRTSRRSSRRTSRRTAAAAAAAAEERRTRRGRRRRRAPGRVR